MVDGRKVYEEEGLEKYMEYQLCNENVILTPGPAFRFVKVPGGPRPTLGICLLQVPGSLTVPSPSLPFLPLELTPVWFLLSQRLPEC